MEEGLTTSTLGILESNAKFLNEVQDIWRLSPSTFNKVKTAMKYSNQRYALISNIPIRCQGENCPYIGTCNVDFMDLPVGERCPMEIATLLTRFEKYCNELEITEDMAADMGQVKELIDLEVMILRCDSKIAMNVDFVEKNLIDVTKCGTRIYEKKITQENQFKLQLYERHSKILKDLNASRDSKADKNTIDDASNTAATIIRRIKELTAEKDSSMNDVLNIDYTTEDDEYIITEDEYTALDNHSVKNDNEIDRV